MNISKTDFTKIVRDNGFDDYDVNYFTEDNIFGKEAEADIQKIKEMVLKDAEDTLKLETSLEASGDISYIIGYLERYKEVVDRKSTRLNSSH